MHILFVATNLPVPPNNGQAIRSLSIIQALSAMGHEVSFISFADGRRPQDLRPLSSFCRSIDLCEREMLNLTQNADHLGRVRVLLTFRSYALERFKSEVMREMIRKKLNTVRYDLIVCDGIYALANIPETATPIALNCHNVEHIILKRYAMLERNPVKKFYAELESHFMRIAECRSCHQVSAVLVCSEVDRELLLVFRPNLPIVVAPNVVDTDSLSNVNSSFSSGDPVVLFQGGMDWYPNRDAVEYFARDVLPQIRLSFPNVRFVIAGRNPPARFVQKFRQDSLIEFTGTVPAMRPYLAAASLVVVPLRIGGGTRIKILEACAAGKAVVSTTVGAEGLNLEAGKEIIVADDPSEFAASVIDLLNDPHRCETIATLARAAVVQRYNQQTLKKSLEPFISSFGAAT